MSRLTTYRLTVALLLACLAVSAWWTGQPRTSQQAVGWCVEQRGREVRFIRCAALPGFGSYGKVVGVSPQMIDTMPSCPPETDEVVRSPLAAGLSDLWLCLDMKPGAGNTRG
jgi:hypothetical protein